MKIVPLILSILFFISCGQNNTTTNTNQIVTNYSNACCCNTIFDVGVGKIFVPSMFTPNFDGINDKFKIIGDSNIKYITNVSISNSPTTFIRTLDTIWGGQSQSGWDGLVNNITFEGNFNCTFKVIDKTNTEYSFTGNSASFIKSTHASNFITNYTNCKFEDQLDFASFSIPFLTNEFKFQ